MHLGNTFLLNVEVSHHAEFPSVEEVGEALVPGPIQWVLPDLPPRDLHVPFLLWMRKF